MSNPVPDAALPVDAALVSSQANSELALFTRALTLGDEQAWAGFYDRYRPRLFGYLSRSWQGEVSAVDDLLQETFLRAVRHIRVFEEEDVLWSWLTVLARSTVADQGRRRSRWWRFLARWHLESELRTLPSSATDLAQRLDAAMNQLSPDCRQLLEAKYYHQRSVRELASASGLSEKAIEGRLSRARRKLAKKLSQAPSQT